MPSLTIVPVAARSIRALVQIKNARVQQAISRFAPAQVLVIRIGIKLFTNNFRPIRVGQDPGQLRKASPAGCFHRNGQYINASGDTIKLASIKLKDVTDGLSSTIIFGESRWECSNQARLSWAHSSSYDRTNTAVPINYDSCISGSSDEDALAKATAAGKTGCEAAHNWKTERGFKSQHPGVITVMMADGSVHIIAETADHFLFNRLGCRADQLVASVGTL